MKNNKGFTLVEILAVIALIGILSGIGITALTRTVDNSRKNLYIQTAKRYIEAFKDNMNLVNYDISDTDATYYINIKDLKLEGKNKSPYADFDTVKDYNNNNVPAAYVVITIDENDKMTFYWTSKDKAGWRIDLTSESRLTKSAIYNDKGDFNNKKAVSNTNKILFLDATGENIVEETPVE